MGGGCLADTPAAIRRLLRRCLRKDRVERLADAWDARLEMVEANEDERERLSAGRRWRRRAQLSRPSPYSWRWRLSPERAPPRRGRADPAGPVHGRGPAEPRERQRADRPGTRRRSAGVRGAGCQRRGRRLASPAGCARGHAAGGDRRRLRALLVARWPVDRLLRQRQVEAHPRRPAARCRRSATC